MRPLHAVLLLVAVAFLAAIAWLLVRGDELDARSAAPLADAGAGLEASAESTESAELQVPAARDAAGGEPARARVAPATDAEGAPSAAAAETAARRLTGRLVDAFGQPVAGAFVYAVSAARAVDDLPARHRAGGAGVRRSEETAGDGRFAVPLPAANEVLWAVRAPGYAPVTRTTPVPAGAGHDLGDVELVAGVRLAGRVVDADGLGVAGAELRDLSGASRAEDVWFLGGGHARGELVATTDASGRFEVDRLASGPWALLATADGLPPASAEGRTARPGEVVTGVEIRLAAAAAVAGRVTGAPEPEALTVLARYVEGPGGTTRAALGAAAAADRGRAAVAADGSFTIEGLRRGALYRLTVTDQADELFARSRATPATVPAGARDVELAYRTASALVFRVVDASTGEPLERFVARAGGFVPMPLEGPDGRARTVHEGGRVRFELEADGLGGTVRLEVSAAGYAPYEREGIALSAGDELDLGTIALQPVPMLTVTVRDGATGAPVEGARVRLERATPDERPFRIGRVLGGRPGPDDARSATTPETGRVRLSSLPGEAAVLRVSHPDYAPWASELALPVGGDAEQDVRLGRGGDVTVIVVDADGAPLGGIAVEHRAPDGDDSVPPLLDEERTDAEGRLVFERLAPGEHRFRIHDGGDAMFVEDDGGDRMSVRIRRSSGDGARRERPFESVTVVDGGEHELRLVGEPRGRLVGRVDEGGAPLAGAVLRLVEPDPDDPGLPGFGGDGPQARSDGEGRYAFESVAAGEYELRVTHPDRAMAATFEARVEPGDNELDVHLARATLEGRVTDEEGAPLAGVRVSARRHREGGVVQQRTMMFIGAGGGGGGFVTTSTGAGDAGDTFTDAEGRYALHGVATDVDLVVEASLAGRQPGRSEPVSVGPDRTRGGVDVVLELGGELAVEAVRADGSPGRMCLVNARRLGADGPTGAPKVALTDDAGRTSFDGLEPGTWRVTVSPVRLDGPPGGGGGDDWTEDVEVRVGETREVTATVP